MWSLETRLPTYMYITSRARPGAAARPYIWEQNCGTYIAKIQRKQSPKVPMSCCRLIFYTRTRLIKKYTGTAETILKLQSRHSVC